MQTYSAICNYEELRGSAQPLAGAVREVESGYDRRVGKAIYAIDAFPDDNLLWRIDWIGGVRYNANVPSEP